MSSWQQPPQGYVPQQRSNTGVIVALVVAIVALGGVAVWWFTTQNQGSGVATDPGVQSSAPVATEAPVPPAQESSAPSSPAAEPSSPAGGQDRADQQPQDQGSQPGKGPGAGQQTQSGDRDQSGGQGKGGSGSGQGGGGDKSSGPAPAFPDSFAEFSTDDNSDHILVTYESSYNGIKVTANHFAGLTSEDMLRESKDIEKGGNWICGVNNYSTTCATDVYGGTLIISISQKFEYDELAGIGEDLLAEWN